MKTTYLHTLLTPVKGALAAAVIFGTLPAISLAQVQNGGFESGTNSWIESGGSGNFSAPSTLTGQYATNNPTEGSKFGLIQTGSGGADIGAVTNETISQSFTVSSGSPFLSFNYRFLTDGYNDPLFNPAATVTITPGVGSPLTLLTISRDDLQAGGAGNLLAGASYFDIQTISQTAWQSLTADLSAYNGQSVTLSFSLSNGGDTDYVFNSQLAVDQIQTSAVPEPSEYALALLGASLVAWRVARVRKNFR